VLTVYRQADELVKNFAAQAVIAIETRGFSMNCAQRHWTILTEFSGTADGDIEVLGH